MTDGSASRTSRLDGIKQHRLVSWVGALGGAALFVVALLTLPGVIAELYNRYFPGEVDEGALASLDTGQTQEAFQRLLGAENSRRQVSFGAVVPGADTDREVQTWTVLSWVDEDRRFTVTALVDTVGTVQAYGVQTLSTNFMPKIPVFAIGDGSEARLRASTFSNLVPSPTNTGTTLSMQSRTIAEYATSTMPKYVESYYIVNPEYRTFVLALGGEQMGDPGDATWADEIRDLANESNGSLDCGTGRDAWCTESLPGTLRDARARWSPNSFWVLADGVELSSANDVLNLTA